MFVVALNIYVPFSICRDEAVARGDVSEKCENFPTNKVRYFRGVGMERRLKSQHGITAKFKDYNGEASLTLCGPATSAENARQMLQREPGMSRSYHIPVKQLKKQIGRAHV